MMNSILMKTESKGITGALLKASTIKGLGLKNTASNPLPVVRVGIKLKQFEPATQ